MWFLGDPRLVRLARRVAAGDEAAEKQFSAATLRKAREARGLLEVLDQAAAMRPVPHGIGAIVRLLAHPESEGPAAVVIEEASPVLDRLAGAADERLWNEAMRVLAAIGSEAAVAIWARRFVEDRPQRRIDYFTFLPLYRTPRHPAILFPRILEAFDHDPRERFHVLGLANSAHRTGEFEAHPLAGRTEAVCRALEESLAAGGNPDLALEAAIALAHLPGTRSREVLARALASPSQPVRMEAAFALGHQKDGRGVDALLAACRSPMAADRASAYLRELGLGHRIPDESRSPEFRAKAKFAEWLAHPSELGHPPDEIEVVDTRRLEWPAAGEARKMWLLRYLVRGTDLEEDEVGVGLVGTATWCFFGAGLWRCLPEDVYAVHLVWELQQAKRVTERKDPRIVEPLRNLLRSWSGAPIEDPDPIGVLEYERTTFGLVSGRVRGEEGWAALDPSGGAWYPQSRFPEGFHDHYVLDVHVGRRLLGFPVPGVTAPTRPVRASLSDEVLIARYEELWSRLAAGGGAIEDIQASGRSLRRYAEAMVRSGRARRAEEVVCDVALRAIDVALAGPEDRRREWLGYRWSFDEHFETVVQSMVETGCRDHLARLLDRLEPEFGASALLGAVAWRGGLVDRAESQLRGFRTRVREIGSFREMATLAEIHVQRGRPEDARALLLECLSDLRMRARESDYLSEIRRYDADYQHHRAAYLRLLGTERWRGEGLPDRIGAPTI